MKKVLDLFEKKILTLKHGGFIQEANELEVVKKNMISYGNHVEFLDNYLRINREMLKKKTTKNKSTKQKLLNIIQEIAQKTKEDVMV